MHQASFISSKPAIAGEILQEIFGWYNRKKTELGVVVMPLDDHLRNSLATQHLAASNFRILQGCECIEDTRDEKDDGSSDQARG